MSVPLSRFVAPTLTISCPFYPRPRGPQTGADTIPSYVAASFGALAHPRARPPQEDARAARRRPGRRDARRVPVGDGGPDLARGAGAGGRGHAAVVPPGR